MQHERNRQSVTVNKLQILERLKSQGVVFQCGHCFTPLSVCIFPVLHLFECSVALIWAAQLWNYNNDHFKGYCTSFQAVARVNSVGYNSTLFCRCLANFGKLLRSVNDVNMTRTMSHDPKKGFETAAHLVLPFRSCSICNVLLNRCTTKWNPFFNEKEGRGKNRRLFFSSWGFCSPPSSLPTTP